MAVVERYSKKAGKKLISYKTVLSFTKPDDVEIYRRFIQLYSGDIISDFCKKAMQKGIDSKDFLCFTLFDDIDTFSCERSLIRDILKQ